MTSLVRARAAARRWDFKIILNMTLMRANIEELPEFVRLAHQLGADEVSFWGLNEGENYQRPDWVCEGRLAILIRRGKSQHYPNLFAAKVREAVAVARDLKMQWMKSSRKRLSSPPLGSEPTRSIARMSLSRDISLPTLGQRGRPMPEPISCSFAPGARAIERWQRYPAMAAHRRRQRHSRAEKCDDFKVRSALALAGGQ